MKLLACHIDNFGKISDLSMNFTDGINVLNEENGWGKSTLASFLKVMFYGFDAKKEKDAIDKERKIYQPWQGGTYGGEVDFEINGKRYRVSRTFGKTEKSDQFHLFDLSTNLESEDYSDKLGEEIFDLDSVSFKRSVFIAQNDALCSSSDAINAKLGNLAENTNDINNYETAQSNIKDLMNKLSPDRATGSLKRRKSQITDLQEELKKYAAAEEAYKEKKALLEEKTLQKEQISAKRDTLAGELRSVSEADKKAALKEQYNELCQDEKKQSENYQSRRQVFPAEIPDQRELDDLLLQARGLGEYETTIQNFSLTPDQKILYPRLQEMFQEGAPSEEQLGTIASQIRSLEELKLSQAAEQLSDTERKEIAEFKQFFANAGDGEEIEQAITNQIDANMQLSDLKDQLRECESKRTVLKTMEEQMNQSQRENVPPKKSGGAMLFTGIAMIILGVIFLVAATVVLRGQTIAVPIAAAGAVCVFLGGILLTMSVVRKQKDDVRAKLELAQREQQQEKNLRPLREVEAEIAQLKEHMQRIQKDTEGFLGQFGIYCEPEKYQTNLYELKGQQRSYAQLMAKMKRGQDSEKMNAARNIEQQLESFFHNYYEDISEVSYQDCIHDLKSDLSRYEQLRKRVDTLHVAQKNYQKAKEAITSYLRELSIVPEEDVTAQIASLQTKAAECRVAAKVWKDTMKKKQEFEKLHDVEALHQQTDCKYSIEELNGMIADLDQQMEELRVSIENYNSQLDQLQEQMDKRDESEAELEEALEQQSSEQEKYEVLKLTQTYLQTAKEQFTARYMAPVSNGFAKYYQMLTGQERDEWMVDANIELKMKEQGEYRDTKWLSTGYQDLIGVCMRLALVDAMYPDEKPFLILDDPFVNLDMEKMSHGNAMLKKLGQEYQTIYFTCHDSRVPE